MGNITGAMVFQSAIPTVVALVLAGDAWHVNEDSLIAFLSAGHRVPRGRRDLRADVAPRRASTAARCSSAERCTSCTSRSWASRSRACCRSADPGPNGPTGVEPGGANRPVLDLAGHEAAAARRRTSPGADPCSPSSRPTPRPDGRARRSPRRVEDLIAYFEGEYVPLRDAKVSIMTHAFMYGTATFEGIRGVLERRAGDALRPVRPGALERIRNSAKMLLMENLPSGRRAGRDRPRDGPPQPLPRGRLHPPVVLQEHQGDRRPAPPSRPRAVRDHVALRELHRHREGRPGHDLAPGAATRTRRCRPAARSSAAT